MVVLKQVVGGTGKPSRQPNSNSRGNLRVVYIITGNTLTTRRPPPHTFKLYCSLGYINLVNNVHNYSMPMSERALGDGRKKLTLNKKPSCSELVKYRSVMGQGNNLHLRVSAFP